MGRRAVTVRVSGSGRNVGKTTLATRLIEWLAARGYTVSAVKRTHHPVPPDREGADTTLMADAGATRVAFSGPDGVLERSGPATLDELVSRLSHDSDVIVIEGYRDQRLDVEFHLTGAPPARVAIQVDGRRLDERISVDDIDALGGLIERRLPTRATSSEPPARPVERPR